jgi:glucose-1-phosphate thymidylyltransferase
VLDQQPLAQAPFDIGDNRIEGRVIIDASAEVTSSTILGPTIIGPLARVSHSWIGPYTSIGASAEIEGAEIERSIISDGARIMHVGGRIAGSTVGRRASIFKDFTLPRAMRLHVGEGVELALN